MGVPLRQNLRIGTYLMKHRLKRTQYYPFIIEIEPLFACNLSCPGCGKIQYPTEILRQRLSVEQAVNHPQLRARRTVRTVHDRILGDFTVPGVPLRFSERMTSQPAAFNAVS